MLRAANTSPAAQTETDIAARICRAVAELPDRDSPEDWPEAMLVTHEELTAIVKAEMQVAAPAAAERLPDPLGCRACTHPDCGRFDGPRSVECAAMAFNSCARPERAEPEVVKRNAARYAYLRSRPLDTIQQGGVFAGRVPHNVVLNGDDLDAAIDEAEGSSPQQAEEDTTSRDQYKRMFLSACEALGAIGEALGLHPEAASPVELLTAIHRLKANQKKRRGQAAPSGGVADGR